jgi:hypothetical protein
MTPNVLGKLFDQFRLILRIQPGPKQVAKIGPAGGSITQLQAGGDINFDKVLVVDASALPDVKALAERVAALEVRAELLALSPHASVEIKAKDMSIIKAYDLEGSRIHLAFEVRNRSRDTAVTVTEATFTVNDCILRTKQFYVNTGQARIPDPTTFPISIESDSANQMSIEFENAAAAILYANGIEAKLELRLDRGTAAERFVLDGPQPVLVQVLGQMQKLVEARKTAYPLDVPIVKPSSTTVRL